MGNEAEQSPGPTSQTTSIILQHQSRKNKQRPSSDSTSDGPLRWGDTRLLSGCENDIILSGNTLRNTSLEKE